MKWFKKKASQEYVDMSALNRESIGRINKRIDNADKWAKEQEQSRKAARKSRLQINKRISKHAEQLSRLENRVESIVSKNINIDDIEELSSMKGRVFILISVIPDTGSIKCYSTLDELKKHINPKTEVIKVNRNNWYVVRNDQIVGKIAHRFIRG